MASNKKQFSLSDLFENIGWLGREDIHRHFYRVSAVADVTEDRVERLRTQINLNRDIADVELSRMRRTLNGYDIAIAAIQHPIDIHEPYRSRFEAVETTTLCLTREQADQWTAIARNGVEVRQLKQELATARAEIADMKRRIETVLPTAVSAAKIAAEEHLELIEANPHRQGDLMAAATKATVVYAKEIDKRFHG